MLLIKKRKPEWLLLVTIATAVYLAVEFAFNARLLDVVGGTPSAQQVHDIEQYGRAISGFAVALMLWGWLIEQSRSKATGGIIWAQAILFVSMATALIVPLVSYLEARLVDHLVENSSAETRQTSIMVVMLQKTLASGRLTMSGFDLPGHRLADPDGKAFLTLYSPLVARIPGLDEKFAAASSAVAKEYADISYGGEQASTAAFKTVMHQLGAAYSKHFVDGSEQYRRNVSDIQARQISAWDDYRTRLKANGLSPGSRMSSRTRKKVVSEVQRRGVPVPDNWQPGDRTKFNSAVARRVQDDALATFRTRVGFHLGTSAGTDIQPGMSLKAFLTSASVQAAVRERLSLPKGNYTVVSGENIDDMVQSYRHTVYRNVVAQAARQAQQYLALDARQFTTGGDVENLGKDFVRMMVVPSIALAFSILGALVHVWKLAFFVLQLSTGRSFMDGWRKSAAILVLSFCSLYLFSRLPTTDFTSQDLYQYFKEQVQDQAGSHGQALAAGGLTFFSDAIIHAQPILYPVFENARINLMRGFEFGYIGPMRSASGS